MPDQIDFPRPVPGPQVHRQDVERGVDFAVGIGSVSLVSPPPISVRLPPRPAMSTRRGDSLDIDFFQGVGISHHQPDARRWCYRPSILPSAAMSERSGSGSSDSRPHTLSPNPHIRARIGC